MNKQRKFPFELIKILKETFNMKQTFNGLHDTIDLEDKDLFIEFSDCRSTRKENVMVVYFQTHEVELPYFVFEYDATKSLFFDFSDIIDLIRMLKEESIHIELAKAGYNYLEVKDIDLINSVLETKGRE
jgi:hypothetical protein